MPDPLSIQTFTLGQWQTNCFVLSVGKSCWIVDAGFDPEPMLDAIDGRGLHIEQVVLTHAHLDHIAGLHTVRHRYPDVPVLVHADEEDFLTDTRLNLSAAIIDPVVAPEATGLMHHGEQLTLNGVPFEIRHTPGHSPGGITLYQPDNHLAIVGDTLFAGSIGRFDFPTSDGPRLMQSISEQLMTLPDDTRVLPGHGPETSIGQERATNPYLNQPAGRPDGLVG
ncbi:MAG: MBL fold metallo-hydrolase [Phycisphaeraceae bacterium]|nr:MBL fold metallo-hydrolase [Phycisphaeraceae bacterium]